jgi:hypothetical protein
MFGIKKTPKQPAPPSSPEPLQSTQPEPQPADDDLDVPSEHEFYSDDDWDNEWVNDEAAADDFIKDRPNQAATLRKPKPNTVMEEMMDRMDKIALNTMLIIAEDVNEDTAIRLKAFNQAADWMKDRARLRPDEKTGEIPMNITSMQQAIKREAKKYQRQSEDAKAFVAIKRKAAKKAEPLKASLEEKTDNALADLLNKLQQQ